MDKQIANLCEFLDASCSVYHAHAQLEVGQVLARHIYR